MTTPASDSSADTPDEGDGRADHRLPQRQDAPELDSVVIKFSNDGLVLELEGDDVDLGTDLKVRREHRLIAEFRRDAVDGWWYKSAVLSEPTKIDSDA